MIQEKLVRERIIEQITPENFTEDFLRQFTEVQHILRRIAVKPYQNFSLKEYVLFCLEHRPKVFREQVSVGWVV